MSHASSSAIGGSSIGGATGVASITVPDVFRCPIGANIMRDPVTDPTDGKSYDRANIVQWLAQHSTSPQTRQHLTVAMLVPNRALKDMIDAALATGMTDSSGGGAAPAPAAAPVSFFASAAAGGGAASMPAAAPVSFFARGGGFARSLSSAACSSSNSFWSVLRWSSI